VLYGTETWGDKLESVVTEFKVPCQYIVLREWEKLRHKKLSQGEDSNPGHPKDGAGVRMILRLYSVNVYLTS
jgi:hypothetical protein